jgi:hypothetical protein
MCHLNPQLLVLLQQVRSLFTPHFYIDRLNNLFGSEDPDTLCVIGFTHSFSLLLNSTWQDPLVAFFVWTQYCQLSNGSQSEGRGTETSCHADNAARDCD